MATNNFGLEQPAYLSDGETAVNSINANMTKLDSIYAYCIVDKMWGEIVSDSSSGQPVISRLNVIAGG